MRKKTKKKSFPSIPRPSKSYSRKKSGVYESRDIREDYDGEKNGVGSVVNNNYLDSSERSTGSSQSRKSSRSVRSFGRKSSFRFGVGGGRSKNKKNKPPAALSIGEEEDDGFSVSECTDGSESSNACGLDTTVTNDLTPSSYMSIGREGRPPLIPQRQVSAPPIPQQPATTTPTLLTKKRTRSLTPSDIHYLNSTNPSSHSSCLYSLYKTQCKDFSSYERWEP